nr:anthrax toxin receptor-like isoform X1 [Peromyscus maniculatus bairdii]XP_042140247.1 anthrax toxin receptor-like isoform X1 [Peromyscus maniculatus bairdii]XP_042140248.1 anthrax toxin receptor-like isoform X1 [Peromyscus maniculatus bairdii]
MPCSALFLLLLLLPPHIVTAGSLRYHGPGWKLFPRLGKGFRTYNQRQIQHMRQNLRQGRAEEDCQGIFDLYFILDKSGSAAKHWKHVYSFTENLVKKFQNSKLRMSFITYSTDADILMPLTSDREAIDDGLFRLQKLVPEGRSYMQKGFMKANEQIRNATLGGNSVNSVIIALTDRPLMIHSYKETLEEANKARRMGATVYTVGVHEYNKQQIIEIADSPNNSFGVDNGFPALQDIIDMLVSKSCTEVLSVEPSKVCIKDSYKVNISGHGFDNAKALSQVLCRFTFSDSRIVDEAPIDKSENTISCPGPKILHTGEEVFLEVSLNNGLSFIGNKLIITGNSCGGTEGDAFSGSRSGSIPSQLQQEDPGLVPVDTKQADPKQANPKQADSKQADTNDTKQADTNDTKQANTNDTKQAAVPVSRAINKPAKDSTDFDWNLLLLIPVVLVAVLLLLCCSWKWCRRKPKKPPPPAPPSEKPSGQASAVKSGLERTKSTEEPEDEERPPPSTSPPAPHAHPPPAVNPNPTVIVACCGCGNRRVQGSLDTCYNYFQPSCHQMPLVWCHPKVQGRCANFTVVNPGCSSASCSPKICLSPNRNCFHLTQAPCTSRLVLQPNGECFSIPQASCSSKICLGNSGECLPVTQTLCSKMCLPNQKYYAINYPQSPCPTGCTGSPSRMLPLLTPHTRQSVESLCHTHPRRPSSKGQNF